MKNNMYNKILITYCSGTWPGRIIQRLQTSLTFLTFVFFERCSYICGYSNLLHV